MRISCPECHFSREIPDERVPSQASLATCPKCGAKFHFREVAGGPGSTAEATRPSDPRPEASSESSLSSPQTSLRTSVRPGALSNEAPHGDAAQGTRTNAGSMQAKPGQDEAPDPNNEPSESNAPPDLNTVTVEVPFERLDKYGFFQGVWQTIRRATLSPTLFFRIMPLKGYMGPLVFYILLFQCAMVLEAFWSLLGVPPLSAISPVLAPLDPITATDVNVITLFVFFPAMAGMMAFLSSGVVHALLMLFRAGDRGYEATFRALAYSNATLLLSAIPYGYLPGMLWGLAVFLIGLKNLHRSSWLRLGLAFAIMMMAEIMLAFAVVSIN